MSELTFTNNLKLVIELNPTEQDEVLCNLLQANQILTQHKLNIKEVPDDDLITAWFLHATKDILFNYLPFNNFDYSIQKEVFALGSSLKSILTKVLNVIKKTNDFIIQYAALRSAFKSNHKIFIYNVDQNPFIQDLYKSMQERTKNTIEYNEMKTGWDKEKREFFEASYYPPEILLQKLLEAKIKRIISINTYYLDNILSTYEINFLAVCCHLNIEWITINNDTHELNPKGYLNQSIHHYDPFTYFCTMPNISRIWNEILNLKNITYVPVFRKKLQRKSLHTLNPDYQLFIYSHSRLEYLYHDMSNILAFYQCLDPNNIFQDFQQFYYAIRHLLLNDSQYSLVKKVNIDYCLSIIHFSFVTLVKFIIIEHLQKNSRRKIVLFGDEQWEQLFPSLYQHKYLNDAEVGQMLNEKKYLQIIFNQNYSYYENNPAHLKAMLSGNPFLCFPPVVNLPQTSAFSALEYNNLPTLLTKTENINVLIQDPLLQTTCQNYIFTMNQCLDNYTDQALNLKPGRSKSNTFMNLANQADLIFKENMGTYMQNNNERITKFLDHIFSHQKIKVDMQTHPLNHYEFFRKIVHTISQTQSTSKAPS